jgi:hypothetical protein
VALGRGQLVVAGRTLVDGQPGGCQRSSPETERPRPPIHRVSFSFPWATAGDHKGPPIHHRTPLAPTSILYPLSGDILRKNYPGWRNPYQQLTRNGIPFTERFGLVFAHVSASDARCPVELCIEIVTEGGSAFHHDIGVWGRFVVDTEADTWIASYICRFYGMFSGCEDDCVSIQMVNAPKPPQFLP